MSKLIIILKDSTLTIARLSKKVNGSWVKPRCHQLRYTTRANALCGYFIIAGRLASQKRLHKASVIEN